MKIKKIIACLLSAFILGLIIYIAIDFFSNKSNEIIGRGQFAKAVALCIYTEEECADYEKNYFEGQEAADWYVPYMNKLYNVGYLDEKSVSATKSSANKDLTYKELKEVIENLDINADKTAKLIKKFSNGDKVKLTDFEKIYETLLEQLDSQKLVQKKELIIINTNDTGIVNTSEGDLYAKGIDLDDYTDVKMEAYIKGSEILLMPDEISREFTYGNAYVEKYEEGKLYTFINGAKREFKIKGLEESVKNVIVDLNMKNGKLVKVRLKQDTIGGKVLEIDETGVEIEKYARLSFTDDFKVYKNYGNIGMKDVTDILVGYDVTTFIVAEGKICAAIITKDIEAENIRVLIKDNGDSGLFHRNVQITCSGAFTLTYGESTETYEAGRQVDITAESPFLAGGRVKIQPVDSANKLTISSITKNYGTPSYRGSIEVAISEGGLLIINDLPLEEYLYSVIPSEMPVSYGLEALYVQAVCARTYAYRQLLNNSYSRYGAHVDDSISYQVYNNTPENELSIEAVNKTYGKILTYNGEVIEAFFFSTSAGSTTDATVWGNTDLPYIKGRLLTGEETQLDLSNNDVFNSFIRQNYDTYDSEFPWYRWNCTLTLDELGDSINKNLNKRYQINTDNILTGTGDGSFASMNINSIGKLQKMEVTKRSTGGVIAELTLYGSEKTVLVKTESNIRNLITVNGTDIYKNDGSITNNATTLPSAYFALEEVTEGGSLKAYKFVGGGFGHGAGLSQNATKKMAEQGMTWEEILKYFYNGVELTDI